MFIIHATDLTDPTPPDVLSMHTFENLQRGRQLRVRSLMLRPFIEILQSPHPVIA